MPCVFSWNPGFHKILTVLVQLFSAADPIKPVLCVTPRAAKTRSGVQDEGTVTVPVEDTQRLMAHVQLLNGWDDTQRMQKYLWVRRGLTIGTSSQNRSALSFYSIY